MSYLLKRSYAKSLLFGVLLVNFALFVPAQAMDEVRLQAAVASLADGAEAQRLEAKIADFVKSGDRVELTKLAEQIQVKDGDFLDLMAKVYDRPEGLTVTLATDPNWQRIGLSMGPCHYANIAIRLIAISISKGIQPAIRNGVIVIDGTQVDSLFAESMHRCELVARLPKTARQIGSSCAMTGDCGEDPDLLGAQ